MKNTPRPSNAMQLALNGLNGILTKADSQYSTYLISTKGSVLLFSHCCETAHKKLTIMIAFINSACTDVNGVSMAAISKETATAISFPLFCSEKKCFVFFGVFMQSCH